MIRPLTLAMAMAMALSVSTAAWADDTSTSESASTSTPASTTTSAGAPKKSLLPDFPSKQPDTSSGLVPELKMRRDLAQERRKAQTLVAAGLATLVYGYGFSAFTAWAGDGAVDFSCAMTNLGPSLFNQPRVACPPSPYHVLYQPVAGPIAFLTNPRPNDPFVDFFVGTIGVTEIVGVIAAVAGLISWSRESEAADAVEQTHVSWQILPAASATMAGTSFQLRF